MEETNILKCSDIIWLNHAEKNVTLAATIPENEGFGRHYSNNKEDVFEINFVSSDNTNNF